MSVIRKEVKKIHEVFLEFDQWFESPFIFMIRVVWGILFILEGWYKLTNVDSNVTFYSSLHIPYPEFMVYLSGAAEFFGGLCMAFGFLTRLAMIPLSITMIVALITDPGHSAFLGHGSGETETFLAQIPLVFLYACLTTLLYGPGKWSLDYHLKEKFFLCR